MSTPQWKWWCNSKGECAGKKTRNNFQRCQLSSSGIRVVLNERRLMKRDAERTKKKPGIRRKESLQESKERENRFIWEASTCSCVFRGDYDTCVLDEHFRQYSFSGTGFNDISQIHSLISMKSGWNFSFTLFFWIHHAHDEQWAILRCNRKQRKLENISFVYSFFYNW